MRRGAGPDAPGAGGWHHPLPQRSPALDGRPDLERVLAKLGEREITSLIIEGGAMVNWAALSAGIVDKIFFYYAPKILAGTGSIPFALGAGYRASAKRRM